MDDLWYMDKAELVKVAREWRRAATLNLLAAMLFLAGLLAAVIYAGR